MADKLDNKSIVNEIKQIDFEVFKTKADDLTRVAIHLPHMYHYDAKVYLNQKCGPLIELLGVEKYEIDDKGTTLDTDTESGKAILKGKDGMLSEVKALGTEKENIQIEKRLVRSNLNEIKNRISSDDVTNSSQDFASEKRFPDSRKISMEDSPRGHEIVILPLTSEGNMNKTLYQDDKLEIFCESVHGQGKEVIKNDDNGTETFSETLDEAVDKSFNPSIAVRNTDDQSEDMVHDKSESEVDTKLDVTELIKCIPKLSQYMDVDPRNVKVLKDEEGDDDTYIHLSVELSDGTVQKFKIAGYVPGTNGNIDSDLSGDSTTEFGNTSLVQKHKIHVGLSTDAKDGLTVMGRRLRARQYKTPIVRRGPGRPKNENIPAPEKNEKGETFYRCEECKATVKSYNALIVHMRTHTGSRPFHCSFCKKSFTTKGNMKAHETTTHSDVKPWKCEYCEKSFKEKKVLKIHERIHTGEKPYSCSICDKSFSQRSVMLEHMFTHSNSRPHLCDFCGQGFRGLSSLKAHKKRHAGLRDYKCDSCERAFVCKNELKRHMLTHTGEKPYSCHICLKAFTRHSYLKEHINLHTGARPYACIECNLTFSDTTSLHRHKKKHLTDQESFMPMEKIEVDNVTNVNASQESVAEMEQSLLLEIPEHVTLNEEQTSIQLVVDENTSIEDFQKLHSLLLSATGNGEMMMNSQDAAKHLYQVLCVNPNTQEVLGQVQGQEVIVEGQSEDITEINLQHSR